MAFFKKNGQHWRQRLTLVSGGASFSIIWDILASFEIPPCFWWFLIKRRPYVIGDGLIAHLLNVPCARTTFPVTGSSDQSAWVWGRYKQLCTKQAPENLASIHPIIFLLSSSVREQKKSLVFVLCYNYKFNQEARQCK